MAQRAMAQQFAPAIRVTSTIDEGNRVTLTGNTHPSANAKNDRGRVTPDLPMTDLIMVLSRAPEQQAAFDAMVASQYNPESPDFHHWLTPQEVGADFGPSETDIATITNWLTGHGFSIGEVSNDRMSIRFSGTAAQVESAFHTEIHNLEVKGVQHIGNMSDPQIPAALAPAVVGVKSLHNFFARPLHTTGSKVMRDSATGKWQRVASVPASDISPRAEAARPQFGISVPKGKNTPAYLVEDVTPYDFATIYNVLPLWTASTPIDGTGQIIAIAGTSAINAGITVTGGNGNNDVATFRSAFGLPAYTANQFTMVSGNSEPLTVCTSTDSNALCGINDLIENSLDVEWSGGIAKGANIILVASYPASASDDNLYDSESYIVNNKVANIMNVSYGNCELAQGTAGNVEYYNLWQTAASEGIAVFVSSGDGGSADCDDSGDSIGNPYSAQYGLTVSGLASTPFNTAVGGTDFNWCSLTSPAECTATPYWNSTNAANDSSAKGYVPEVPWNDTCASPLSLGYLEGIATGFGITGVSNAETACNFVYNNWSTYYTNTGGSNGGINLSYYVDTVGGGGGASGCVVSSTSGTVTSCTVGSTSTGASNGSIVLSNNGWPKPSWQAGVSGIPTDGVRDLPDISFFGSDGFLSSSSYLICVSADNTGNAACSYSATSEPFAQEVGGTSVSSATMAGVMALINQKAGTAQGSPNTELYKLAAKQTYSSCSAESVTAGSTSCYFNDIDTGTNAMPCDYGATEGDPAQTGIDSPNCSPKSGDLIGILPGYSAAVGYDQATGLGSMNVANVVTAWPTNNGSAIAKVTVSAQSSISATSALSVPVTVASSTSGGTTPTGSVTISGAGYRSTSGTLVSGAYTFTIPANSLAAGSDVLTATYSGDTTYSPATGSATVTVTGSTSSTGTFSLAATTPSAVAPGTSATSTVTVTATGGYAGTATLSCALTSSPSGAVDLPGCSFSPTTVTLTSSTTSGTATATVTSTAATTARLAHPQPRGNGREWLGAGSGSLLALVILLGIPARRRSWRAMLGAIVLMAALGGVTGCGDFWQPPTSSSAAGTTAGNYTFTVTGTGSPTVTAVTTTFTVTVN
jgi:subtilase family serine protease